MHLHLVRFQILDRRTFDTSDDFLKKEQIRYLAPAEPPAPDEQSWKDLVQCPSGMVTHRPLPPTNTSTTATSNTKPTT